MKRFLLFFLLILFTSILHAQSAFDKMTNEKMQKILYRVADKVEGKDGNWQVIYKAHQLLIITDSTHNRMRIISPVAEEESLDENALKILMEANFDRALDAKYSLFNDILWSGYTHPLAELTVEQFKDAIRQVTALVDNYGTSFASTDMVFGGNGN